MADETLDAKKAVVLRFNREVLEGADEAALREILGPGFVNRTAPAGLDPGVEGMWGMVRALKAGIPDLRVEIHAQIAEGDLVSTRKTLRGTHAGPLMGVAPTGRTVAIEVMDLVRVEDGRYAEHWGINTLQRVLQELAGAG